MSSNTDLGSPSIVPPRTGDSAMATAGTSAPTLGEAEVAVETSQAAGAPTLTPPTAGVSADTRAGEEQAVTATWRNGVKIDALWAIDEQRNTFVHVVGVGWKKIFNGRDGAFSALVTLASQARQTNRPVNLREEADGMVYEIYLW
jgi:hypothetical protein